MRSLAILLALAASATCAEVTIIWQHAKSSSDTSLSVFDGDNLIAQSCSSFISDSTNSIDFSNLDENGNGNFTVGQATHMVRYSPGPSGDPSCIKVYNDKVTVVDCTDINWEPSTQVEIEDNCHDDEDTVNARDFLTFSKRSVADEPLAERETAADLAPRAARLAPRITQDDLRPCHYREDTRLVGDGNPHQNYFHKQLSETIQFDGAGGSVGKSESESYSISWSANFVPIFWINGGFSVTQSWTTGNTYTCSGGPYDVMCVWYKIAHTAYTVQNWAKDTCRGGWIPDSDPYTMFSPNEANRGGTYYCVTGTCRAQGDGYWVKKGRKGGP